MQVLSSRGGSEQHLYEIFKLYQDNGNAEINDSRGC